MTKTFQPRGGCLKYDSQKSASAFQFTGNAVRGCSSSTRVSSLLQHISHWFSSLLASIVLSNEHTTDPAALTSIQASVLASLGS